MKGKYMLTCKQASKLISQSFDRRLSWSNRLQLRLHLFICNACTRFKFQLNQLRAAVLHLRQDTENDSTIQLPSEAKARIASGINNVIESKQP
ncbi:MAG TPA: zf-HC2 domain-containing protein [Methylotenera sp.]|nr:zf-HC2 domain-containing protein [Methylotenera sp.]